MFFRPEDMGELLIELIEDDRKNGAVVKIHLVDGNAVKEEALFRDQLLDPGVDEFPTAEGGP